MAARAEKQHAQRYNRDETAKQCVRTTINNYGQKRQITKTTNPMKNYAPSKPGRIVSKLPSNLANLIKPYNYIKDKNLSQ